MRSNVKKVALYFQQHKDKEDKELLEMYYKDGEYEWVGILLERYTLRLYGVCMKYLKNEEEARDSVQHIFLKVLDELAKYRVEYFKTWLYIVAKNHCLMKLREKGKYNVEINDRIMVASPETDISAFIKKDKYLDAMQIALTKLNEPQLKCIKLFYLEKKSYLQITEETGYSMMQVKSHIQNAKRNLRLHIERMQEDEQRS